MTRSTKLREGTRRIKPNETQRIHEVLPIESKFDNKWSLMRCPFRVEQTTTARKSCSTNRPSFIHLFLAFENGIREDQKTVQQPDENTQKFPHRFSDLRDKKKKNSCPRTTFSMLISLEPKTQGPRVVGRTENFDQICQQKPAGIGGKLL